MTSRSTVALLVGLSACTFGCFHVKTESEIKPIHITMDINLNVDNKLAKEFADESFADRSRPSGESGARTEDFTAIKELLHRKAAGVSEDGLLVAREGATDDERITIVELNARRMRRFSAVAKDSGVPLKTVQHRYANRMREKIPAGSGIWYQDDEGAWRQK